MTLRNAPVIAFLASVDAVKARQFYEGTLGLRVVEDTPFALVVEGAGTSVRIQRVEHFSPQPFTALGFSVPDITASVKALSSAGVRFERYGFMEQDPLGVWTSPGGAKIAWFKDPDGNTLSLTSFAT